jgi:hypothetical protein
MKYKITFSRGHKDGSKVFDGWGMVGEVTLIDRTGLLHDNWNCQITTI